MFGVPGLNRRLELDNFSSSENVSLELEMLKGEKIGIFNRFC